MPIPKAFKDFSFVLFQKQYTTPNSGSLTYLCNMPSESCIIGKTEDASPINDHLPFFLNPMTT